MTRIYLDHNATSPAPDTVIEAVADAMRTIGNASAQHGHGRAAGALIAKARDAVGMAMGQCANDVVFTGSGTEAINTAVRSAVLGGCKHILVSSMDHPASLNAADGYAPKVTRLPATRGGQTDLDALAEILANWDDADGRPFLSIVAANSETGVIQNTDRAIDMMHDAGGLVLVDAVQVLGKGDMLYPADYVAVSAHKIGGPQGVGALYVSPDAPFTPLIHGGGQEQRRRAGTSNVPGIAGFGAACADAAERFADLGPLRDHFECGLRETCPEVIIFGQGEPRLPNTSFIALPGMNNMTAMMALDLAGISVSKGTACASGVVGESRALRAMGLADAAPGGAIRISFGPGNTTADADATIDAFAKQRARARTA